MTIKLSRVVGVLFVVGALVTIIVAINLGGPSRSSSHLRSAASGVVHHGVAPAGTGPPAPTTIEATVVGAGAVAVSGVTVRMTDPTGVTDDSVTDANGEANFSVVGVGTYRLDITVPSGYQASSPTSLDASVNGSGSPVEVQFSIDPIPTSTTYAGGPSMPGNQTSSTLITSG